MNKKVIVLSVLVLVTTYQGYVLSEALAGPNDFQTMWLIELPRQTYFIGESVTFTIVAFASTDPTLMLPDQMAQITIRNSSMAEVYSTWITTNVNGSAPVTWESGLQAVAGNYTIILDDLKGDKVIAEFMLLYNEETFWQTRVGLLERSIDAQYGYVNYLFAYQNYLRKRMDRITQLVYVTFVLILGVLLMALWTWFPELARRVRVGRGVYEQLGKGLAALGITSEPRIYLDHEEVSQVSVPPDKAAPRFNAEHYCKICDPQHENKMTLQQFEDHVFMHDQHYMNRGFWRARRREKARETEKEADKPEKLPEPKYAPVEEYKVHWDYSKRRKLLRLRMKALKKLYAKKKIDAKTLKVELEKVRVELESIKKSSPKPSKLLYKETSAPKVEPPRKVRMEKHISGIPKKPIILDNNPLSIASYLEDHPDIDLDEKPKMLFKTNRPKTAIDELFEKLIHEKVN